MVKPASVLSKVSVALVSIEVGVKPPLPSSAESAIEKQPACAAAISSSGFVPTPFSNRVEKEYCVCFRTPLAVETEPLPSFNPPSQCALAVLCMKSSVPDYKRREPVKFAPSGETQWINSTKWETKKSRNAQSLHNGSPCCASGRHPACSWCQTPPGSSAASSRAASPALGTPASRYPQPAH